MHALAHILLVEMANRFLCARSDVYGWQTELRALFFLRSETSFKYWFIIEGLNVALLD